MAIKQYSYSIADILSTMTQINENILSNADLSAHRLIKMLPTEFDPAETIESKISTLSTDIISVNNDSSSSCFNNIYDFTNRINVYLGALEPALGSTTDITSLLPNSIELKSSIVDFQSNNRLLQLVDFAETAGNTFESLCSNVKQCIQDVLNYSSDTTTTMNLKTNVKLLFNSQNINKSINNLEIDFQKFIAFSSKTVKLSDILFILSLYLEKIKNVKSILIRIKQKTTSNYTILRVFGNYDGYDVIDDVASNIVKKKQVALTISPYVYNLQKNTDNILLDFDVSLVKNNYIAVDKKIILQNLVYDVSSKANIVKNIPLAPSGTNGKFAADLTITEQNNFDLDIAKLQQKFMLYKENIIQRKDVLNAIDYIFQYWFQNMSYLIYDIDVCHTNCHTNIASINTKVAYFDIKSKGFVEVEAWLHKTTGCGCSEQLTYSANISRLIPTKYQSDDTVFYGQLSTQIITTGYKCNINNSPTAINVKIGSSFSANIKTNSSPSITVPIAYKNTTINIAAIVGNPPQFCNKIKVKIPYKQIVKIEDEVQSEADLGITDVFG